jgi:hypothetical protein
VPRSVVLGGAVQFDGNVAFLIVCALWLNAVVTYLLCCTR